MSVKKYMQSFVGWLRCLLHGIKHCKGVYIGNHVHIINGKKMLIGKNVKIRPFVDIFCDSITIGEGTDIGTRNRFGGVIVIGESVLFGPDNFIASNSHKYTDPHIAVMYQGTEKKVEDSDHSELYIGDGSWVGTHCAILGNVRIGKHCIIGANSVVTKDIPDYCVAVGNPAKIIKKYNKNTQQWERC